MYDASDWEIETDTGWQSCIDIKQTIEYRIYRVTLENGTIIECADDHIFFTDNLIEIFAKDCLGVNLFTKDGLSTVVSVEDLGYSENMYDIGVDSLDHRYYTNGVLSHNTTTAAGYLLWYAMFIDDSTILVAAHKHTGAMEIMSRIRYAYELCPDSIRAGVTSYNKQSIEFDNGSRIVAQTTTPTTGRGMSLSLLYCLDGETTVRIRNKNTLVEEDISLVDLYSRTYNANQIIT